MERGGERANPHPFIIPILWICILCFFAMFCYGFALYELVLYGFEFYVYAYAFCFGIVIAIHLNCLWIDDCVFPIYIK